MLGNLPGAFRRAAREHLADAARELLQVAQVELVSSGCFAFLPAQSDLRIGEALFLGAPQRVLLHEESLPLVAFARAAPFQYNRSKRGVPARAACQCRLAGGEEDEMIQVGARQAQRAAFPGERDPRVHPQLLTTLVAHGFPMGHEHFVVEPIGSGVHGGSEAVE